MSPKRHEQELAEIKALTYELRGRIEESQERLNRISRGFGLTPTMEVESTSSSRMVELTSEHRNHSQVRAALQRTLGSILRRRDEDPLVAFVHIPKTAGGTVISMLVAAYSRADVVNAGNFLRSPENTVSKIATGRWVGGEVTVGHVPYGTFREHVPSDTRYMTFLREPLDRVLSHYYRHIHRQKQRRAGDAKEPSGLEAKTDSIEEAIVDLGLPQVNNLATRFLCGDPSPLGPLPASALDEAKANLRQFVFVGIQERFEESVVLLQRLLGLDLIPREAYEDRHVSSDRPAVDEIPGDERELIEEYNSLDLELYAFAQAMFEDALAAAADERFTADVETLRG